MDGKRVVRYLGIFAIIFGIFQLLTYPLNLYIAFLIGSGLGGNGDTGLAAFLKEFRQVHLNIDTSYLPFWFIPYFFVVFLFVPLLYLIGGIGLLYYKKWARWLIIILSIFSLFSFFDAVGSGTIIGTIVGIIFLVLLFKKNIKKVFV